MITATDIYLWGLLGKVEVLTTLVAVFSGFATAIAVFTAFVVEDERAEPWIPRAASVFVVAVLLAVFVPSKQTFAAMYVLPALAKSEAVQKDLPEVYGMAVDFVKKQLTNSK